MFRKWAHEKVYALLTSIAYKCEEWGVLGFQAQDFAFTKLGVYECEIILLE